jgi:hypothetical protein
MKESAIEEAKEKMKERQNRGVVYMSYVPPHVNPSTVRKLLSAYAID